MEHEFSVTRSSSPPLGIQTTTSNRIPQNEGKAVILFGGRAVPGESNIPALLLLIGSLGMDRRAFALPISGPERVDEPSAFCVVANPPNPAPFPKELGLGLGGELEEPALVLKGMPFENTFGHEYGRKLFSSLLNPTSVMAF